MPGFKQIPQTYLFHKLLGYWGNMVKNYDDECRDDDFFAVVRNCFDHGKAEKLIEEAVGSIDLKALPNHLKSVNAHRRHGRKCLPEADWQALVLEEVGIFTAPKRKDDDEKKSKNTSENAEDANAQQSAEQQPQKPAYTRVELPRQEVDMTGLANSKGEGVPPNILKRLMNIINGNLSPHIINNLNVEAETRAIVETLKPQFRGMKLFLYVAWLLS